MKRLLIAAGALCLLVVSASAQTSFAGDWSLDKSKSEGLSPRMANADSVTLNVTQDDKALSFETKVTGGAPGGAPGGAGSGGGPGGGRGGFGGPMGPQKYNLDGSKTTTETEGPQGKISTDYEAKWSDDKKTLELKITRRGNFNGNSFESVTTETWTLADEGKTLKVNRVAPGRQGQGTQETKFVYTKK